MATKERKQSDIQQREQEGRGLLVRGGSGEELRDILVAVYGTLKRGFGNHILLSTAVFISKGKTERKYPMVIHGSGLPFLVNKKGIGHNVDVELYLVNKDELNQLDMLEGHPDWYKRKKAGVVTPEGDVMMPYIYFAPESYYSKRENLYETYDYGHDM